MRLKYRNQIAIVRASWHVVSKYVFHAVHPVFIAQGSGVLQICISFEKEASTKFLTLDFERIAPILHTFIGV